LMIATVAVFVLAAATPSFAQTDSTPAPAAPAKLNLKLTMPRGFTPELAPAQAQRNEEGLGIFVQGGFTVGSTYGENGLPGYDSLSPTGVIFGMGFGGNKSGVFGIGADINYLIKSTDNVELLDFDNDIFEEGTLTTHVLQIPVYGRFNFMGHSTKSAPTLYVLFGGFVDILLQSKIDGVNVKDSFNGFDIGPLVGVGFEVARIGIEYRGHWAMKTLQSTGGGTFLNGLEESKVFTHVLLFKVRLN